MVAEFLYFKGQTVLETLLSELWQHHHVGPEYAADSSELFDAITHRLGYNREPRDLRNALAVIAADLICSDGVDGDGKLCPTTFGSKWGNSARIVLDRMLTIGAIDEYRDRPDDAVTRNELIRFVSVFAPARIPEMLALECPPLRLPLLDYVVRRVGAVHRSVCAMVCVQHLFGSTVPLIQALCADVVAPDGVFVLGKPYSTNHATMWRLREIGYAVHPGSSEYFGTGEYHEEADRHIASLLLRCAQWVTASHPDDSQRILLLDDGGRAIRMLHTDLFRSIVRRFVCVEQTRRGIRELEGLALQVPVVNVAESPAKLNDESPIIAESVCTELLHRLAGLKAAGVNFGDSVLVIGFGAIGNAVADAMLQRGFRIAIYDKEDSRRRNAASSGFLTYENLSLALPLSHIVIGCTGNPVLNFPEYALLQDGTVLASASSSDIEFRAWQLRSIAVSFSASHRFVDDFNLVHERFQNRLLYLGDSDHPCHFLYVVRYYGKRFFLINGGFPVNMDGTIDPIPPHRIQLTRGLLYVGGVQASHQTEVGLHALDLDAQRDVLAEFYRLQETPALGKL